MGNTSRTHYTDQIKNSKKNKQSSANSSHTNFDVYFVEHLIEAMQDGFLVCDKHGLIVKTNDAVCKITGYSRKEIEGISFPYPFLESEFQDEMQKIFDRTLGGNYKDYELYFKHKTGKKIPIIFSPSKSYNSSENKIYLCATVKDITMQKSLEEEYRLYKHVIDQASVSIFIIGEDAKITYVNRQACRNLGYTYEELCRKTVYDIDPYLPKDQWPDFEEFIREQKPNILESFHKRKDGSLFPVFVTAYYLRYQNKNYSISISQDISDRKQSEIALRESENRYRLLFELESDAIVLIDNETGRLLECNAAAEQLYGYSRDELLTMTNTDLSDEPKDTRRVTTTSKPNVDQVIHIPLRYHRKKNGQIFPVEITGRFFFQGKRSVHIAAIRDITERLQAETQMKNLAKFPEENPNPVLRISKDGKIIYANQASSILLNHWKTGVGGKLPARWKHINDKILKQKSNFNTEVDCGKHSYSLIFTKVKEGDYINIYGHDITSQKHLEVQLRQSQKMEAIGHLAGGIAHDFNNLLTIINGYSELMLGEMDQTNPYYKKVNHIRQSGQRAEALTRQLLAFSRKQILQPVNLDVNQLLKEMEKMLKPIIGENIVLKTTYDKKLKRIKADPGQIEQVIMNLVVNSRDAMPEGGELLIETTNIILDDTYIQRHNEAVPGVYVLITVSDNGMGMDKKTLSHIFEPFFTTKAARKGTGLGLSTVYGIIKQSEGYIYVYSEPGKGTIVKIYLKATDQKISSSYKLSKQNIQLGGRETILVVEDEQAVLEFAALALKGQGYNVLEAPGPVEALKLIKGYKKPIHVLLTDVIMPVMSGKELAGKVQSHLKDVRIIYMSGYTDNAIVYQGIIDKGNAFLQKPFTSFTLLKKIKEVLTNKKYKN